MGAWFFGGYAVFLAALMAYAAHVALSCPDPQRRELAYRVLKLLWCGGTFTTGLAWSLVQLHQAGLL